MTGNPELIAQYRDIHASRVYGDTSIKNLRFLRADITLLKPQSILDYGCGQSRLLAALRLDYPVELLRYDPAIPKWSANPTARADLLLNIDVLEHIEARSDHSPRRLQCAHDDSPACLVAPAPSAAFPGVACPADRAQLARRL